jgi:glutathione peroxidase
LLKIEVIMNIYDFNAENVYGDEISLREYEGEVLLIVNSATQCGFTPQYDDLEKIYEKFAEQGFDVLEFPCNQFGKQAPGSNEEIATFCDAKFGLKFSRFSKVDVNGENALPLFKFLQNEKGFAGFDEEHPLTPIIKSMMLREHPNYENEPDIKWNFTKFLIDRNGNVVKRFEPTTDMHVVEEAVKELL